MKFNYKPLFFEEKGFEKEADGQTWRELIKNAGLVHAPYVIYSDDTILHYPDCADEKPSGEVVTICLEINGGGFKSFVNFIKNPLNIVLAVVGVALVYFTGGVAAAAGWGLIASVGVGAVGSFFTSVPKPENPSQSNAPGKNKYALISGQNESQAGNSWPCVLGRSIIMPPYVANYYALLDNPNSGNGVQYFYGLLNLGYGNLSVKDIKIGETLVATNNDDVRNGKIKIDGDLGTGAELEIRQDGTIPALYGSPRKLIQVGANVQYDDGFKNVYTSSKNTTKITWTIGFAGLYYYTDSGAYNAAGVALTFYYKPVGTKEWISAGQRTFTAATNNALMFEYSITVTRGQYDVCVVRNTYDNRDRHNDRSTWQYVQFDIDAPIMADEQLAGSTLLAFRVEANEIINNILNKVSCVAQLVAPVYIGRDVPTYSAADWGNAEPTSDPAAIYLACLKGKYMPKPVPDNLIDWDFLARFSKFCATHNYTCNGIIAEQEQLGDILQKICATARTSFYIKNGCYSGVIDDVQPAPYAILSPKNTKNFSWTRQFGEKVNAYTCAYQNADDSYATVAEDVYLHGEEEADGDVKVDLSLWGVDNHEQTYKIARYMLANARIRREVFTCEINIAHFALPIGGRVLLSHDVVGVGIANGWVVAVDDTGTQITVDESLPTPEAGVSYGVQIAHQNTDGQDAPVETLQCAVHGNIISLPNPPSAPIKPGDFWAYGILERITEDLIVKSKVINDSPQLSATLTLIPYAPQVFDAENQLIPEYEPIMSIVDFKPGEILTPGNIDEQYKPVIVIDNGLVFFDFSTENYKSDGGLINFGGAKQFCDAEFVGNGVVSVYDHERAMMWAKSANGGYFKHLSETALYNPFSITFFLRGDVSTISSKQTIVSYNDTVNNYSFELFVENGQMAIDYNNARYVFPPDVNPGAGKHYAFVRNMSEILVYIDGIMFSEKIPVITTFDDEGSIADEEVVFDDEQSFNIVNEFDNEGIFLKEVVGQSNTVPLNWLASSDGSNVAIDIQIANVRLFAWTIATEFVNRLKNLKLPEILNISVPKYFGENTQFPTSALSYDWIKYTGDEPLKRKGQYYRKNAGDYWELYVVGSD